MSERLHRAAEHLAEVAAHMQDCHALGGLTCTEAEAIADVLRAIDATEAADTIIEAHGAGDDDIYDAHHDLYLRNVGRADEIAAWRADIEAEAEAAASEDRHHMAAHTAELLRGMRGDSERISEAEAALDDIAEGRA